MFLCIPKGKRHWQVYKLWLKKAKYCLHLFFLDLHMPITDGWEFLEDFLRIPNIDNEQVNIYINSSSLDPMDMIRSKSFGVV
jgi:CheY-like chemotaxis protein